MTLEVEYEKMTKRIASNLKRLRKKAGLTQFDMIDHGFNYRHYQRIESGVSGVSLFSLLRLARVFKVKVSDLFD